VVTKLTSPPRQQRFRRAWQKHVGNRVGRALLTVGIAPPIYALLETTGRKTGKPRRTPVGNGLVKGTTTFWLVSEYGTRAAYVRNILANPRVRVKIGRRWRRGTAHVMPEDDARQRQRHMNRLNAAAVRFFGDDRDLLTIRIDLDATR
jgi:deazaflavin-dependent oxidoreductase (nitroreductase family)